MPLADDRPEVERPGEAARRIVVGIDGSANATEALEWAAAQAHRTGAILEIVTAFGPGAIFVSPSEVNRVLSLDIDEARLRAEKVAPGITITNLAYGGLPEAVLMNESVAADLLVVGSRGRGGFKGLLLGSVSRKCVHRAQCPVVIGRHEHAIDTAEADRIESEARPGVRTTKTLKEGPLMSAEPEVEHRIVVGIDGSPSSIAALQWAANQAELTGASLEVLMAWEWPYAYGWSPVPNDYDPARDSKKLLDAALVPIREAHPGTSIQATVIEGHPAPQLVKAAHGADLLVVGSRGHGEFAGMLLGSVSEHCVTNATCPVLVLRDQK